MSAVTAGSALAPSKRWRQQRRSCRLILSLSDTPSAAPERTRVQAKRSIAIEILGLPLAVSVESARPHDVSAGRRLLARALPELGTVRDVLADRGYRGLGKMAARNGLNLHIKAPPKGSSGFTPIRPLYKVEHAFARLGRWRRLSRCYEGSAESGEGQIAVAVADDDATRGGRRRGRDRS
jgi:transposase